MKIIRNIEADQYKRPRTNGIQLIMNNKTSLYFLRHLKEIRGQYDQDLQQDQAI